jgi:hypothetical protein
MTYAPVPRNDTLINKRMKLFIVGQSTFQIIVTFTLLYAGPAMLDIEDRGLQHNTIIFNTFIFLQLFNEINARKVHRNQFNVFEKSHKNIFFIFVMIFSVTLQMLMVYVMGDFAGTEPLGVRDMAITVLIPALSLPLGVLINFIGLSIPEAIAVNAVERLRLAMEDGDAGVGAGAAAAAVPLMRDVERKESQALLGNVKKNQVVPEESVTGANVAEELAPPSL